MLIARDIGGTKTDEVQPEAAAKQGIRPIGRLGDWGRALLRRRFDASFNGRTTVSRDLFPSGQLGIHLSRRALLVTYSLLLLVGLIPSRAHER